MKSAIRKTIEFAKKEAVLSVAIILTIITCFFVPIDKDYITYFDYNTLVCLFCMLAVVAGLKNTNIFELISRKFEKYLLMFTLFNTLFLIALLTVTNV